MQWISLAGFSYPAGATLSPDRAGLIADGRVDELCPAHEVTVAAYLAARASMILSAAPGQSSRWPGLPSLLQPLVSYRA